MPVEAILPFAVFGTLLILWILLPNRSGEDDLGSKIRNFLLKRRRNR